MKGKWKLCVISGSMFVFVMLGALMLLSGFMASANEEKKEFSTSQSVSGSGAAEEKEVILHAASSDTESPQETEAPTENLQKSPEKKTKKDEPEPEPEQPNSSDLVSSSSTWFSWVDEDQLSLGERIAEFAKFWQGVRYEYGGATLPDVDAIGWVINGEGPDPDIDRGDGRGVDSSGFVQAVFKQYKKELPRSCKEQAEEGDKVEIKDIEPGDIIFYGASDDKITHCGIAIGNGKVVHSSSKAGKVIISDMNYRRIVSVRRVI